MTVVWYIGPNRRCVWLLVPGRRPAAVLRAISLKWWRTDSVMEKLAVLAKRRWLLTLHGIIHVVTLIWRAFWVNIELS